MAPKKAAVAAATPLSLAVGKQAQAALVEFDGPNGTGNQVPDVGPVSFSSDDTAVATVDPSSGVVTAVEAGTCNISGTDAGNSLSASAPLEVTDVAVSATLTLTTM